MPLPPQIVLIHASMLSLHNQHTIEKQQLAVEGAIHNNCSVTVPPTKTMQTRCPTLRLVTRHLHIPMI